MTTTAEIARLSEAADMLHMLMACPPRTALCGPSIETGTHCTNPGCTSCQRSPR